MSGELGALFLGAGLNILEGYGLTETSPVIAVKSSASRAAGHRGRTGRFRHHQNCGGRRDLVRGASIMKGYWNKPEATAEAIDKEGWFHTGDIGEFKDNYLKITDRKKDLLVLANGKKVAPAPIEMKLAESPLITQVVLLGDSQKGVAALLVPDMKALQEYAKKESLGTMGEEELVQLPAINKLMRGEVERLTGIWPILKKSRKSCWCRNRFPSKPAN
jgi:long-chain acyl-CoA synthetase